MNGFSSDRHEGRVFMAPFLFVSLCIWWRWLGGERDGQAQTSFPESQEYNELFRSQTDPESCNHVTCLSDLMQLISILLCFLTKEPDACC